MINLLDGHTYLVRPLEDEDNVEVIFRRKEVHNANFDYFFCEELDMVFFKSELEIIGEIE